MHLPRSRALLPVLIGLSFIASACGSAQAPASSAPTGSAAASRAPASSGAAAASQAGTAKQGGTITVAMSKDLQVLNPLVKTISTDQVVRLLMFEPLLASDDQGNIKPKLAESWKVSGDGKTYTFTLRKGVKFHNGKEMTAEDVKFDMEYTMDRKNGAYGYDRLSQVQSITAVDPYALQVELKDVSSSFLPALDSIEAFSVVPKDSLQPGVDKPNAFPPGTGPFKYVSWTPKQQLVVDKFADYWGQKANVDRVIVKPIEDATVRITALRSGDVDMIERTPYEWVDQIKSGKLQGIGLAEAKTAGYRRIVFNYADPPFNNLKLRQAVSYAIDMKEIQQAAYNGFGQVADQKYPKGNKWYVEGVPSFPTDLDKAKQLVAESGYKGEPLEMVIENASDVQTVAATMQSQLKRVGINVTIRTLEFAAQRELIQKGQFTVDFMGTNYYDDPFTTYAELLCENPRNRITNYAGYCNQDVDNELHQLQKELDPAKEQALLKDILTKEHTDMPQAMGLFVPRFYAFRDVVKDFQTDDDGNLITDGGGLNYAWLNK